MRSKSFNQGGSGLFESGADSKNKIINVLENHVLFLEEEIRRKNNTIDSLIQGLTTQTSLSFCQNSKNVRLIICNPQKDELVLHQNVTLRPSKSRKDRSESINGNKIDTQKDSSAVKKSVKEKSEQVEEHKKAKRENVYICGDSLVNGIDGDGVSSKDFCTIVKSFGGATSADMIDYVKPTARKKPDKIIVHVGTNDITKKINNTKENWNSIVKTIQKESPDTKNYFSELCVRYDISGGFSKINHKNEELKKFCNDCNIGLLENRNIDNSCLARKQLHLNPKGLKRLALNFKSFLGKN